MEVFEWVSSIQNIMHNSLHCRDFRLCFPSPMSLIVESILVKKFEYHLGRISSSRAQLVAQVSGSTQVQVSGSTHPARADGTIYIAAAQSAAPSSRPVRRFTHQPRPQPCAAPSAAPRSSPVRRPEQPPRPPLPPRSSQIAYGLFLVHLKPFFLPGYLSGI